MDIVEIRRQRLREWFDNPMHPFPRHEKSYISQLITGRASFGEKAARRLEKDYGMGPGYLDNADLVLNKGEEVLAIELKKLGAKPANPILDEGSEYVAISRVEFKLSAGIKGFAIEPLNGENAPIFFRKDWLDKRGYDPKHLHAIEVTGSSMEPSLFEGDLVVVNTKDIKPVDGEVFAANFEGELVVKRLIREAGKWWLSSDNADKRRFPNKLCDENCFVLGRIIFKQSERI
jgi:phage repressor protein C with HTH and peptisase S24 domain